MNHHPPRSSLTRRKLLGAAVGLGVTASAGCLGSIGGSGGDRYDPTPVSDPPDGTPEEFYYVLEERVEGYDITVEALYENDGDLILEYHSAAETELEAAAGSDADRGSNEDDGETDDEVDDSETDDEVDDGETDDDVDEEILGDGPVQEYTLDEIGIIADAFNEVLMKHGDGASYGMLVGDIVNPIEGQAYGWGAKSTWFEQFNEGQIDEAQLLFSISQLQVYEEDVDEVS